MRRDMRRVADDVCLGCVVRPCRGREMDLKKRIDFCMWIRNYVESPEDKEMVDHPSHYNQYPKETIDMMVDIFGREATRQWCVMTAFKYRMRLGFKDDIKQDLAKEQWYLNKAKELE